MSREQAICRLCPCLMAWPIYQIPHCPVCAEYPLLPFAFDLNHLQKGHMPVRPAVMIKLSLSPLHAWALVLILSKVPRAPRGLQAVELSSTMQLNAVSNNIHLVLLFR